MKQLTIGEAIERFGIDIEAEFIADDPIPVHADAQAQGDVLIVPANIIDHGVSPATGAVPAEGVPVVRGENGGNTHLLLSTPGVTFDAVDDGSLVIGRLTVADDSTAYLAHPEHGYVAAGPGTYEIRRQREQADEIRMVRD